MKKSRLIVLMLFCCCPFLAHGKCYLDASDANHPFYIGLMGGYGSTTWQGLVPAEEHQNAAIIISTPNFVREGGAAWGVYLGYEFLSSFALEASYMRYPNAKVSFDEMSLVAFEYGIRDLYTRTETVSLMAKIMMLIPHTPVRAFSAAGIAGVHRSDQLNNSWQPSPTFAIGFNYNFTPHIMGELGVNYTGGYGKSELNPVEDFIPFLYSAFLRLAYRF